MVDTVGGETDGADFVPNVHRSNAVNMSTTPTSVTRKCNSKPVTTRSRPAAVTIGQILGAVCSS